MQIMRALSFEAYIIHYLYCCFDLAPDARLRVVEEMSNKFAAMVDSAARLASDPGEDDPLHSIASLYQTRANSKLHSYHSELCQHPCPFSLFPLPYQYSCASWHDVNLSCQGREASRMFERPS